MSCMLILRGFDGDVLVMFYRLGHNLTLHVFTYFDDFCR